jgi:hypothetical protein
VRVPKIPITDNRFNYIPSAKTDIRETFRRVRAEMVGGQESLKPLVASLNPESFALRDDWFQVLE